MSQLTLSPTPKVKELLTGPGLPSRPFLLLPVWPTRVIRTNSNNIPSIDETR